MGQPRLEADEQQAPETADEYLAGEVFATKAPQGVTNLL